MTLAAPLTAGLLVLGACGGDPPAAVDESPQTRPRGVRPGGDTTRVLGPSPTFLRPATNLPEDRRSDYYAGKALATQPWVRAPTTTDARDGLGPLYHARSCLACHVGGGRGPAADQDGQANATLVRLSVPGRGPHGEPVPEPTYGTQLQPRSTSLRSQLPAAARPAAPADRDVPAEANVRVDWTTTTFAYPDGSELELRRPTLDITSFGYGDLNPTVRMGMRHTPSLAGMGLLAGIDVADLERLADPHDADDDGISGRINQVWDPESRQIRPGRFGLKANQPSLRVQVAAALSGDMGLSSPVFPNQPCTQHQARCLATPNGNDANGYEVPESLLTLLVEFTASIAVLERRQPSAPAVLKGQKVFDTVGCADCHTPRFVTEQDERHPHLSSQEIWPYTDLLLHDMGPGLADGREDFDASGSEWRTPPLWGAGLARAMHARVGFLHDGRARSIEEAIVWHDAEARASRDQFAALDLEHRRALISFVRSL